VKILQDNSYQLSANFHALFPSEPIKY